YEGKAVAIDLDADVREASLRETLRLRPMVLRRLGWHYHRVHSFDLFANPGEVALRIARTIGYEMPAATPQAPGTAPTAEASAAPALTSEDEQVTGVIEGLDDGHGTGTQDVTGTEHEDTERGTSPSE